MRQYETFELVLQGEEPKGSFVDVDVTAEFTLDGSTTKVKGFYAGNGIYKIRFYPKQAGTYHYEVKSNDTNVSQLPSNDTNASQLPGNDTNMSQPGGNVNMEGDVVCDPAIESKHGMVRADGIHFKYDDGNWYYPFGTTVYALVHQEQALIDQTMQTLKTSPFNKVRMCMFPKHYDFNQNDPLYYAFENIGDEKWDTNKPCFEYWDELERRIKQLEELGIQCDLILFHPYDRWGFAKLPVKDALTYLDYAVRRLSAFPNVWWSLANEYDLMMNYKKEDWEKFADYIHAADAYGHLLSNHECFLPWDYSNKDTTHICHQIKNVDVVCEEIKKYQKPCMVDECRYEGNLIYEWGNLSAFEMVNQFWKVMLQGGYCTHGEVYMSEDDILWWGKGGILKGQSPKRIAFLKDIVDSLPGPLQFAGAAFLVTDRDEFESIKKQGVPGMTDNSFMQVIFSLPWERVSDILRGLRKFLGCVGDEAFLMYYERQCTSIGELILPEDLCYDIEVIDVWEMTRTKVLSSVSGKVRVNLPGKEGMALLARKV